LIQEDEEKEQRVYIQLPGKELRAYAKRKSKAREKWDVMRLETYTSTNITKAFSEFLKDSDKLKPRSGIPRNEILVLYLKIQLFKQEPSVEAGSEIFSKYLSEDASPRLEELSVEKAQLIYDQVKKSKAPATLFDLVLALVSGTIHKELLPIFLKSKHFREHAQENGKPRLTNSTYEKMKHTLTCIQGHEIKTEKNPAPKNDKFVLTRSSSTQDDGQRKGRFLFSAHRLSTKLSQSTNSVVREPDSPALSPLASSSPKDTPEKTTTEPTASPEPTQRQFLQSLDPPSEISSADAKETPKVESEKTKETKEDISTDNSTTTKSEASLVDEETKSEPQQTEPQAEVQEKEEPVVEKEKETETQTKEQATKPEASPEKEKEEKKEATEQQSDPADEMSKEAEKLSILKAKLRKLEADIQEQKKRRQTGAN